MKDYIYILFFSIAQVVAAFFITSMYGPAINGDSMAYLSVADSLLSGRGMVDSFGGSLTQFPPLFPILLWAISSLFRSDVLFSAWVLNIVLFGINFMLMNIWLYRFFQKQKIYFYVASWFIFLSTSNLMMHTAVLTEPLYLTLILLFFIYSWLYSEKQSTIFFVILVLIAMLSPLLRFSGFSQILAGVLLIIYVNRKRFFRAIFLLGIFIIFSFSLIAIWLSMDNFLRYRIFIGDGSQVNFVENLLQALRKIMYWFLPYRPISQDGLMESVILLGLMIIVLFLINKKEHWVNWLKFFIQPAIVSMMLFTIIYFLSTTSNVISVHHRDLSSDRYYVVIMLPILVFLISIFDFLIRPNIHFSSQYISIIGVGLFLIWCSYPISKAGKFVDILLQGKPHYYNVYNIRAYQESATLRQAKILLKKNPGAIVYSNLPRLVWLHTRVLVSGLPEVDASWSENDLNEKLFGWPGKRSGYIVFLDMDPYQMYLSPDSLEKIADLKLIYDMEDGAIFYVSSK